MSRHNFNLTPQSLSGHAPAEDKGFEPSVGHPTHVFQACALDRHVNPPVLREE